MLNSIREHWQEVVEMRNSLHPDADGAIYLMSVEKRRLGVRAGRISCNTQHVAALMLVQGTHRLAEPHEVEAWKAEQLDKKQATLKAQAEAKMPVNINLGDALLQLLTQQASQAQTAPTATEKERPAKVPANPLPRHNRSDSDQAQSA